MKKPKDSTTVIRRRSNSYTTHFINGCSWQYPEPLDEIAAGDVIIQDFLFRSTLAGEPFEATFDEQGRMIAQTHEKMLTEEILVGVAMPKAVLLKISALALETFGDTEDTEDAIEELKIILHHSIRKIPVEKERSQERGQANDQYFDTLLTAYKWVLDLVADPEHRKVMMRLIAPDDLEEARKAVNVDGKETTD